MKAKKGELDRVELLRSLSCAFGVSGDETDVMAILDAHLKERFEWKKDRLGNHMYFKSGLGKSPRILLAAHADEIGFMVQAVHPQGFLSLVPVGSWTPSNAIGMPVQIKGRNGLVDGVIGTVPPHHQKAGDAKTLPGWEDLWVDIGARDADEVRDMFGVRPSDRLAPLSIFRSLGNGRVLMGKAWDDRVGCALMTEVFYGLEGVNHPNSFCGVATVQEEVGARGAAVVANRVDADLAIILEGAPADDLPSGKAWEAQGRMGKGVQIRSYDISMMACPGLADLLVTFADTEGIPYQVAVRRSGGTDGGALHRAGEGLPSVVLSVPVRYAHNGVGMIDTKDYQACLDLLLAALRGLTMERYQGLLP